MKVCVKCKVEKSLEEFHKNSRMRDGKNSYCKVCNNASRMANYRTAAGKERNYLTGLRQQNKNRWALYLYMTEHPCVDCGETNPVVLDFDHRDPTEKSFNICGNKALGLSWKTMQKEIEKCDVRCANCHRLRTAVQQNWYKAKWWADGLDRATPLVL